MKHYIHSARTLTLLGIVAITAGCNISTNVDGTCTQLFVSDFNAYVNEYNTFASDYQSIKGSYTYQRTTSASTNSKNTLAAAIDEAVAEADHLAITCANFAQAHGGASCEAEQSGSNSYIAAADVETDCQRVRSNRNELILKRSEL